jgi:hypothetical protein
MLDHHASMALPSETLLVTAERLNNAILSPCEALPQFPRLSRRKQLIPMSAFRGLSLMVWDSTMSARNISLFSYRSLGCWLCFLAYILWRCGPLNSFQGARFRWHEEEPTVDIPQLSQPARASGRSRNTYGILHVAWRRWLRQHSQMQGSASLLVPQARRSQRSGSKVDHDAFDVSPRAN